MSENQENKGNINKLADILFAQIENINSASTTSENFKAEISKANTVQKLADSYLKSAEITMQAVILQQKLENKNVNLPKMLGTTKNEESENV